MAAASYLASYSRASPSSAAAAACPCHARPPALRPRRARPLRVRAASSVSDQEEQLLAALRAQADPGAALRTLSSALAREGFDPGRAVYEEVIAKLGAAGAFDLMEELVGEMRRGGHEVTAGVVRPFLEGYARLGRFDDAVDLVLNRLDDGGVFRRRTRRRCTTTSSVCSRRGAG
ncbi:hypothetical protein U9M48_009797 [Paspalum notatum var. saurae]|uniref:Uncharacterized protein n=1 Tax=Paspalum notatum var. saurae TaxID=547442 RepID=A0AAQ3STB8_PASNO